MELTLTLDDLLTAKQEVTTILSQELDYATKFAFLDLNDILTEATSNYEVVRTDIIKQLGTLDEASGNYIIKTFDNEEKTIVNENFRKFQTEITKLLKQEKVINFTPIPLENLKGVKSGNTGSDLRKFISR